MSHFTVLVIGDDYEKELAPFHEFECTGMDDEYIQTIDETASMKEDWQTRQHRMIKLSDGRYVGAHDDDDELWPLVDKDSAEFNEVIKLVEENNGRPGFISDGRAFRVTTSNVLGVKDRQVRINTMPEDAQEVEVPASEYMSFREYVKYDTDRLEVSTEEYAGADLTNLKEEYKYGFTVIDEAGEVVSTFKRTNPNAKWDWYQLGGRWSGSLTLKGEKLEAIKHMAALKKKDKPIPDSLLEQTAGIMVGQRSWMNSDEALDSFLVDAAKIGDIDLKVMLENNRNSRARSWDKYQDDYAKRFKKDGDTKLIANGDAEVTENLPTISRDVAHEDAGMLNYLYGLKPGDTREQYINDAKALSTYAVIKDGQWYQRGEMGWFGISSDEKDPEEWDNEFNKLLEGLPPETKIAVVDCHI